MDNQTVRSILETLTVRRGLTLEEPALEWLCSVITVENRSDGLVELHIDREGPHAYRIDIRRLITAAFTLGAATASSSIPVMLAACAFIAEAGGIVVELPEEAAHLMLKLHSADGETSIAECYEYLASRGVAADRARNVIDTLEILRVVSVKGGRIHLNDHVLIRQRGPLRLR